MFINHEQKQKISFSKLKIKKILLAYSQFSSVDRMSACGPKGLPSFDSGQGRLPWLQAAAYSGPSLVRVSGGSNQSMFLSH